MGRATQVIIDIIYTEAISIHALRGEGDSQPQVAALTRSVFQSTPSVGRATKRPTLYGVGVEISIHALRGEGDLPFCDLSASIDISIHALRGEGDLITDKNSEN